MEFWHRITPDLAKLLELFSKELAPRKQCQSMKSFEPSPQIIGTLVLIFGSILHVTSENHS